MTETRSTWTIPRTIWVGLVAAALYIFLAAVGGNLLSVFSNGDETVDFVLGHYIVLPILIALGILLTRRAGWTREVWTSPSPFTERRRWWMLAIPILLTVQTVVLFFDVPWSEQAVSIVLIYLVGTLMVGFGEEFYFRGIFRVTVLGHHRELAALLITSFAFGFAHTVGYLFDGLGLPSILLNTLFIAMDGALFYGALRATGTLWVPILLHGLGDLARYLSAGENDANRAELSGENIIATATLFLSIVLSLALVVSIARQDRKARHDTKATTAHLT